MTKVKKEHYVPQCYLKNFSKDRKKLFYYNKQVKNDYHYVNIADAAEERYFYDLDISNNYQELSAEDKEKIDKEFIEEYGKHIPEMDKDIIDDCEQFLERFFSKEVEDDLAQYLDKIKYNTYGFNKWVANNCYFISEEDKHNLTKLIVYQFIRTPYYRYFINQSHVNVNKKVIPVVASLCGIDITEDDVNDTFNDEQAKLRHILSLSSDNAMKEYAPILFFHKWVLIENMTSIAFVTSDNPISLYPTKKPPFPWMGTGLSSPGMVILYPISDKLMIAIIEDSVSAIRDRKIVQIYDAEKILLFNSIVISNATKYIYCIDKKTVELVDRICDRNPKLRKSNENCIECS